MQRCSTLRAGVVIAILAGAVSTGCAAAPTGPAETTSVAATSAGATSGATAGAPTDSPDGTTTAVVQGTTLPADWPVGLDLPSGATLVWSTVDTTGMSVLFDAPQDLAALETFFDRSATGLGFAPESDGGFVDLLSRSWTDGSSVIAVTATPIDGRSSGVLTVRPTG